MEYFIGEGGRQRGPFTIDQLRGMHISPETLVWREGMAQWQPARLLPELQLFTTVPPMAYHPVQPGAQVETKRLLAGLMGIFFGWLGIHKFVLGFTGAGLVYLLVLLCTCGFAYPVLHVLSVIEGIIYLSKSDNEFHQHYVVEQRSWF